VLREQAPLGADEITRPLLSTASDGIARADGVAAASRCTSTTIHVVKNEHTRPDKEDDRTNI
jgi:hypothetical protein